MATNDLKILHTVAMSFVKLQDCLVPWHVYFTFTEPPFKTIVMGLSVKGLNWNHADLLHNLKMTDDFPRSESLELVYEFGLDDFKSDLHRIYMRDFWTDRWDVQLAAVTRPTYEFLMGGGFDPVSVILLEQKRKLFEYKSFTTALMLHLKERNDD